MFYIQINHKVAILFAFLTAFGFSNAASHYTDLQLVDSVYVSILKKRDKVVMHKVEVFETLYSISRFYGVGLDQIKKRNPKIKSTVHLPEEIEIPIDDDLVIYNLPSRENASKYVKLYYRVKEKDNLFQISRIKFDLPTELLMHRNRLESENLRAGQVLLVGWIEQDITPLLVMEGRPKDHGISSDPFGYYTQFEESISSAKVIEENQVALWNRAMQGSTGFLVMHRTIPEKTIIEIRNPMSGVTTYGRVIGQIPENLYPEEVDMIVSTDLAKQLRVLDPRFFVQVRYADGRLSAN